MSPKYKIIKDFLYPLFFQDQNDLDKTRKEFSNSFFVIVPRDPGRAGEVLTLIKSCGHSAVTLKDHENEGLKNCIDVLIKVVKSRFLVYTVYVKFECSDNRIRHMKARLHF